VNSTNKTVRVADYVFNQLADWGVRHVFLVTGGGAMHLDDALAREKRIRYVCNHHEQASAIAAEGYARITNLPGVVCVTSGPGGINAINGIFGAWTDSIPMLVVSGQMKRETLLATHQLTGRLRQLGDQEADVTSMVRGITKYAQTIMDPESIRYHLERAWHLTTVGRPGPVWLDVPVDVQASMIDPEKLRAYDPAEDAIPFEDTNLRAQAAEVAKRLRSAERPVLLGGTGVRLAGAIQEFQELAEKRQIPITTAWTHDLVPSDHPLFCGRQGSIGTRAGNFVVQNADLVLIVGSRLCIRQISYNWASFARSAFTIQVDIDAAELGKPTFRAQLPVHADATRFLKLVVEALGEAEKPTAAQQSWLYWSQQRRKLLPTVMPHHRKSAPGTINQYHFIELLFAAAGPGDIFACGNATACITPFQAGELKAGQRLFSNSGSASMGYDLPAAIGAAFAAPDKKVICLAGDGSLQMNVQELATLAHHKLSIKLFVLNNGGYLSIRSTQNNFFKLLVGEGPESGVTFPDYLALAKAYGLTACVLDTANVSQHITTILNRPGPEVVVVELDQAQGFEPKLSSKKLADGRMVTASLEDMAPFLDRDEFKSHMLVPAAE
jgi:acetolactate synthase-1/2/3 large subunit